MISWHKKGQKVTPKPGMTFHRLITQDVIPDAPEPGHVYTITSLDYWRGKVWIYLEGYPPPRCFTASSFVPVYPDEVERLMRFCSPREPVTA